jgi:pyrroloquinoline quinone biosynthesis protein D
MRPVSAAGVSTGGRVGDADRPRLARHIRLTYDSARERHVLLAPEAVSVLNGTGATILGLCDGRHTVAEIVAELRGRYDGVPDAEVRHFLDRLVSKRSLELSPAAEAGRALAEPDRAAAEANRAAAEAGDG